jgi:hypothetical protein
MSERTDAFLRIEHKLDVIINYLHGMTNVPPERMPVPIKGGGGLTDGTCPITGTPIRYALDPETGVATRIDGLSAPISTLGIPAPEPWTPRPSLDIVEAVNED